MNNFIYSKSNMVNITQLKTLNRLAADKGDLFLESRHLPHNRYLKSSRYTRRHRNMNDGETFLQHTTVHTQTPQTQISYEFDKALYHFKKSVQSHKEQSYTYRSQRLYLPTIIDTTPRPRSYRTHPPLCTCKHRPQRPSPQDKGQFHKKEIRPVTPNIRPDSATLYQSTPVLAVAIRRSGYDEAPIVTFNGIAGYNMSQFKPFVKDVSTQTTKSYVHVEFELNHDGK